MEPGTPIRCEMTKWGDRPHWEFDGVYLGADEHGEWLGFPEGTLNQRPGLELVSEVDAVTLVPAEGWYAATFHAPGIWCDLYVDIATPGEWDGTVLRAVDLDLDVIRRSPTPPVSTRTDAEEPSCRTGRDLRRRRGRVRRAPGRVRLSGRGGRARAGELRRGPRGRTCRAAAVRRHAPALAGRAQSSTS